MTPIFKAIWRDRQRKGKHKKFDDRCGLIPLMDSLDGNLLAFDVSEIKEAAEQLRDENSFFTRKTDLLFPAKGVWLEGLIDEPAAFFIRDTCVPFMSAKVAIRGGAVDMMDVLKDTDGYDAITKYAGLARAVIEMINTPTIVHTTQVSDKFYKKKNTVATYAWMTKPHTVVRLCVDGKIYDAKAASEATGGMPYHLVRGHHQRYHTKKGVIIKDVQAYFRGDKSLGTVTHEYECYSKL